MFAGHQGRDKTLALARKKYHWPTLRIDVEAHVAQGIECAKHKGITKGAAPILQYPVPELPWDVVSIDLLQLPQSHYGSRYILVCIGQFSRYLVLAPLHNKSAKNIAHALVTHLICPFTAPRVLLSDNGTEFRNAVLEEVHTSLKATKEEMTSKQHKRAVLVSLKQGDTVFIRQSERSSKLGPKFLGPYIIVRHITGNKFEGVDPKTNISMEVHSGRLKKVTSNTKQCSPSGSE